MKKAQTTPLKNGPTYLKRKTLLKEEKKYSPIPRPNLQQSPWHGLHNSALHQKNRSSRLEGVFLLIKPSQTQYLLAPFLDRNLQKGSVNFSETGYDMQKTRTQILACTPPRWPSFRSLPLESPHSHPEIVYFLSRQCLPQA